MNTEFALMAVFDGPTVSLDRICVDYLGLSRQEAMRQAAQGELPLPVFRLNKSQKAPYVIHVGDLAKLIDKAREQAEETWKRCQG